MIGKLLAWVRQLFAPDQASEPPPEEPGRDETKIEVSSEARGPRPEAAEESKLPDHQHVQEKPRMPRIVKAGLIQTTLAASVDEPIETIRDAQVERTLKYIDQAGSEGVQIL